MAVTVCECVCVKVQEVKVTPVEGMQHQPEKSFNSPDQFGQNKIAHGELPQGGICSLSVISSPHDFATNNGLFMNPHTQEDKRANFIQTDHQLQWESNQRPSCCKARTTHALTSLTFSLIAILLVPERQQECPGSGSRLVRWSRM